MNKEKIKDLYEKYHVPKHVIAHMKGVAKVCAVLSKALEKSGIKIKKRALMQAALLHDVLRVCDFRNFSPETFPQKSTKEDIKMWIYLRKKYGEIGHYKAMTSILEKMGEYAIANLVRKHDFAEVDNLHTWEEKIMFYSDKRVNGSTIVSLEKRFETGRKRNAKENEDMARIKTLEEKTKKLEREFIKQLKKLPV